MELVNTVYGTIKEYDVAQEGNLLPIGLVNSNANVNRDIKKGEFITKDMVN